MRIGILGGTFDPPHNGHMALAKSAMESLGLDEVIWIPAFQNPLKKRKTTPARIRLEMVRQAVQGETSMAVSDLEVSKRGPSYAVDTLSELQYLRPAEYWFICGADALRTLTNWKQPERLLKLCRIAAAVRGRTDPADTLKFLPEGYRGSIDFITMGPVDVSATEIRDMVAQGRSIDRFVSKPVIKYIQDNKLYRI